MTAKTITVIGSLNIDLVTVTPRVPSGGETLTATSFTTGPGGKGANQAVACARLSRSRPRSSLKHSSVDRFASSSNVTVKMIGRVGNDEFAPKLIDGMHNDGIATDHIKIVDGLSTGVAIILVEEGSGENRILLSPGANYSLRPEDFRTPESLAIPIPDLVILQLEIPLDTVLQILQTTKEARVDVILNPAPAVPLPDEVYDGLTHLILNESEAAILTGRKVEDTEKEGFRWEEVAKEFLAKGVRNFVVTLGGKGAFHANKTVSDYVPAEKVAQVVDTTAAGDTFVGAYAVNIVRGITDMSEVVRLACKASGRTVERAGAQNSIPWADEVNGLASGS